MENFVGFLFSKLGRVIFNLIMKDGGMMYVIYFILFRVIWCLNNNGLFVLSDNYGWN